MSDLTHDEVHAMFLLQWPQDSTIAYEGVERMGGQWAVKVRHKPSERTTYQRITDALIENATFPLGVAIAREFEKKWRNAQPAASGEGDK